MQRKNLSSLVLSPSLFGIYIHWPFCVSKCPYCDFNSHVRDTIDMSLWESSLVADLKAAYQQTSQKKVTSVFFGGGTPSTMPPSIVSTLINEIHKLWDVDEDVEITLEANPNSVECQNFQSLSTAGINRVSLGIQSLNDQDLSFLGRTHSAAEAYDAIDIAQKTFKRHSFDFIYTLPKQSLSHWEDELKKILNLGSSHLSLYQLTIEKGTPFFLHHARGDFSMKTNDQSASFFEHTHRVAETYGFDAYEVSNFSKSDRERCLHNLTYWRAEDYVGIGPGAHGRFYNKDQRHFERRHRAPEKWLEDIKNKKSGVHVDGIVSTQEKAEEILMMGLRLKEGICLTDFSKKTGYALEESILKHPIKILEKENLLSFQKNRLKTTPMGLQKLDGVLSFIFNYAEHKTA